jgi:hypothetical protein
MLPAHRLAQFIAAPIVGSAAVSTLWQLAALTTASATLAVARSIYRHLSAGLAPFWSGTGHVDITHARPGILIEII